MMTASAKGTSARMLASLTRIGKADAGDDFGLRFIHHRNGEVGRRAAEHVRQNDDAFTAVDALHGIQNFEPARFHIVVRADRDRLERRLRSDDMLERVAEFLSKPAMRDNDKSDHVRRAISLLCGESRAASPCRAESGKCSRPVQEVSRSGSSL